MPRLDLLIGMVSLTLCCCATTPSEEAKCGKPPKIKNAYLLGDWDNETYLQGHEANYSCHPGYIVNRRRIKTVCLKGKWTMQWNEHCRERPCGNPGDIPFGTFELISGNEFVFGAVVEYSCDDGYTMMSKQKTRACAADGWTNHPPHCEARLCPPVMDDSIAVQSTVTDGEFSMGHVITLKCKNPRHSLRGPSRLHCTADGTWNMDPPTCKESCTIQENEMRKNNIRLRVNQRRFEDNEAVQFECDSGYKISDPAKLTIQCNSGILKYPTCCKIESLYRKSLTARKHQLESLDRQRPTARKHQLANTPCGRPPSTLHGEIVTSLRDSYPSLSTVTYQCPSLYKLEGRKTIKCRGGIWDNPPLCLEPCTTRADIMTKNHITLIWVKNKKLCVSDQRKKLVKCYVQHDHTVKFACQSGYKISDVNNLISKCNGGILSYPTCFKSN